MMIRMTACSVFAMKNVSAAMVADADAADAAGGDAAAECIQEETSSLRKRYHVEHCEH